MASVRKYAMYAYLRLRMLLIAYNMMCRVCRVCAKRIYRNANLVDVRALSSNGRAPASHAGGRGIDTPSVHSLQRKESGFVRMASFHTLAFVQCLHAKKPHDRTLFTSRTVRMQLLVRHPQLAVVTL